MLRTWYSAMADRHRRKFLAFEYRQQSVVGGTCGHTAVQTVSGFLRRLSGTHELTGADIRNAVSQADVVGTIVGGLHEKQVARALRATGVNVHLFHLPDTHVSRTTIEPKKPVDSEQLLDLVQMAIDSGLPPILFLKKTTDMAERHVIVGVGRTVASAVPETALSSLAAPLAESDLSRLLDRLNPAKASQEESKASRDELAQLTATLDTAPAPLRTKLVGTLATRRQTRSFSEWTDTFVVHDDQRGAYKRIALRGQSTGRDAREGSSDHPAREKRLDMIQTVCLHDELESAVIPLPNEVNLSPGEVRGVVDSYLRSAVHAYSGGDGESRGLGLILNHFLRGNLAVRWRLELSNRFRRNRCKPPGTVPSTERGLVWSIPLPRYLYLAGLAPATGPGSVDQVGALEVPFLGYLLIDSTATRMSPHSVLMARLDDVIILPPPPQQGEDEVSITIENSAPIPHAQLFRMHYPDGKR
jgi:hypothetical protein